MNSGEPPSSFRKTRSIILAKKIDTVKIIRDSNNEEEIIPINAKLSNLLNNANDPNFLIGKIHSKPNLYP